ncbi:hypothetical protein FNW52_09170 [Flavobacterium sp. ZT3R18]|uniref:hypothetical protein n=1 Tax=Flavobacterium sp. ZT3R18 TaxID=2594429 RepID=UPI0011799E92|nr:hypothetical protein [Flavobacterium sp. ZT3R18]TRX36186.1 hypothetical protein FNW52_09170 [Flavobacterium sp. ZT3R18]
MKNFLITMGFITAVFLTTACTTDNLEGANTVTNLNNQKAISGSVIDSISVQNTVLLNGDTDKDRVKL